MQKRGYLGIAVMAGIMVIALALVLLRGEDYADIEFDYYGTVAAVERDETGHVAAILVDTEAGQQRAGVRTARVVKPSGKFPKERLAAGLRVGVALGEGQEAAVVLIN